jgi:hypothetical protein
MKVIYLLRGKEVALGYGKNEEAIINEALLKPLFRA